MRLPPMTTRRWMITVAGAAILCGGWVGIVRLNRLSTFYGKQAWLFAQYDVYHRTDVPNYCDWCVDMFREMRDNGSIYMPDERFQNIKCEFEIVRVQTFIMADHYSLLATKYERAADRPWWPIPPDPAALVLRDT